MKGFTNVLATFLVFTSIWCSAQVKDSLKAMQEWEFTFATNVYLVPSDIYVNPVFTADYKHLHLEARYNYEDFQTASLFGGYHISTGNAFEFNAIPMVGFIFGNTSGIAPGLQLDMYYWKLNFYSESEYLLDFADSEASFIYKWSELTYSPAEWLWFGFAAQRTKLYQTELDIQRGLTLGFSKGMLAVSGYVFNVDKDDPYGVLSVDLNF